MFTIMVVKMVIPAKEEGVGGREEDNDDRQIVLVSYIK